MLAAVSAVGNPPRPLGSHPSPKQIFIGEVLVGYFDGVGIHASGMLSDFAEGFPFKVRLGLGFARVPAGDALLARKVFINDANNGTPTKKAKVWDARLDVMYPVNVLNLKRTLVFAGPRRANFTAHFEYIGGAETFDVNSNHWGIGGGMETAFALSPRVDMVVTAGSDYYFRTTMSGHDTYYRPSGDDLHAIDNYTFKDADAAINQPQLQMRIMCGVAYHF
jgi:hypothetical protein